MEANTMNEVLKALLDRLKGITDFAVIQSNLYVQELLRYELYTSIIGIVLSIVFLLLSIYGLFYIYTRNVSNDTCGAVYILPGFVLLFSLVYVCGFTFDLIKINVAPRVYLIDYLSNKLKSNKLK